MYPLWPVDDKDEFDHDDEDIMEEGDVGVNDRPR